MTSIDSIDRAAAVSGDAAPAADMGPARTASPMAIPAPTTQRIVHVLKHCGYGGGNVHVAVDLACVQAEAGCQVMFVSGGGTFEPLLAQYGVQHITVVQQQRNPLSMAAAALKFTRLCHEFEPEVIHAHMMGGAAIGFVASRLAGIPLVTTVHNSFDKHSVLMRLGDRVAAVCQAEKENLVAQGYDEARVDAVMNAPNESPREAFMPNPSEPVIERPAITAVCGLHRRKGLFDLIAAFATLVADLPEWKLYIAGEGPDREALEQQVREAGLAGRVIFLGYMAAPRALLEQTDIFVLASYADPCSLTIGEARGAGCAIVATAVGGTPEMLEFGRAGRLVSPGRPAQLAAELRALMSDRAAREELRRVSLAGSAIFNVRRLVADYDDVYQRARAM